jgi:DNA-directed RNA polymerase subunit beta'
MKKKALGELVFQSYRNCGLAETVAFLDRLKEFGFRNATRGGVSIGIEDLHIPGEKATLLQDAIRARRAFPARVRDRQHHQRRALQQSHRHLDPREQRRRRRHGQDHARVAGRLQPVFMMFDSGSRGSRDQIRQLAGMRGLMAKPQKKLTGGIGEIIENPIKSNFREGLSVLEYFISTHGAVRVWPTRRSRRPTPATSRVVWWTWRRT